MVFIFFTYILENWTSLSRNEFLVPLGSITKLHSKQIINISFWVTNDKKYVLRIMLYSTFTCSVRYFNICYFRSSQKKFIFGFRILSRVYFYWSLLYFWGCMCKKSNIYIVNSLYCQNIILSFDKFGFNLDIDCYWFFSVNGF